MGIQVGGFFKLTLAEYLLVSKIFIKKTKVYNLSFLKIVFCSFGFSSYAPSELIYLQKLAKS